MSIFLTDSEIADLINEDKYVPVVLNNLFQLKEKRGHKEQEFSISRPDGSMFKVIFRINENNLLDFSIILGFIPSKISQLFRLRRYNGKSHNHTNLLENQTFFNYHIHKATQKYQDANLREDGFAEETENYTDFHGAFSCLVKDCNIKFKETDQLNLL